MCADPKSVKLQLSRQYLFTLLGSAHIKAVCGTLMKLRPAMRNLEREIGKVCSCPDCYEIKMNIFVIVFFC